MKSLQHENVIQLKEIYEGENSFYLIIEYLSGPTLSRFIKDQ
jgi:serine/threonine protein kinase